MRRKRKSIQLENFKISVKIKKRKSMIVQTIENKNNRQKIFYPIALPDKTLGNIIFIFSLFSQGDVNYLSTIRKPKCWGKAKKLVFFFKPPKYMPSTWSLTLCLDFELMYGKGKEKEKIKKKGARSYFYIFLFR